ncbi:MAG TPA: hypothetical protein VGD83_33355 [Streptosporangiaceae bacterium]
MTGPSSWPTPRLPARHLALVADANPHVGQVFAAYPELARSLGAPPRAACRGCVPSSP